MDKSTYEAIHSHMRLKMQDSAHDSLHVCRVLYQALNIAKTHPEVNRDILIASCLLHDIGRQAQFDNPALCHAVEGGKMAYAFLLDLGWPEADCRHVRDCVTTHRYRSDNPPKTIEAQILFDADKLDVTGALGIARSLAYQGHLGTPLYCVDENGAVQDGSEAGAEDSFLREYHFKLRKLYDRFYTPEARKIAQQRKAILTAFYEELLEEVSIPDMGGLLQLR